MCLASSGAFYFVELCLGWHVGFIGKHNMNKKLVMDGRAVAWFYVRHGQFLVDAITAIAWITQARMLAPALGSWRVQHRCPCWLTTVVSADVTLSACCNT